MGYRALYRVWRPQRFDEIVGQPVITQTLKNAVMTGQISHAYLFTGPRGTGKTSAAKILAKAVNCPHIKNGEPCNHCRICRAITRGQLDDVIEIDAASNNGVDEIRNVRDKARYAPTQAKYKVYIIDEVHMLSTGAFNALLKTLEEPPANVIFIMATTEPQKIPATIISRTQRFNFRRIRPRDILRRMEFILRHEKVRYDVKALKVIAKAAEGGMRDALSILDEVMSYGKDHVTYQDALQVTGSVTQQLLQRYLKEIVAHDVKAALADVQRVLSAGKDANQFVESLIDECQNLLLYQQDPRMVTAAKLGIVGNRFKQLAGSVSSRSLYLIIERLNEIEEQMRFTIHPDVYLEVLTVKIATLQDRDASIRRRFKRLSSQIQRLTNEVTRLKKTGFAGSTSRQPRTRPDSKTPQADPGAVYPILRHATRGALKQVKAAWNEVVKSLPTPRQAVDGLFHPVAASHNGIVIVSSYYNFYHRRVERDSVLKKKLSQITGRLPNLVPVSDPGWLKIRERYYRSAGETSGENSSREDPSAKMDRSVKKRVKRILGPNGLAILKIKSN